MSSREGVAWHGCGSENAKNIIFSHSRNFSGMIKLAALPIRRKASRESPVYEGHSTYSPFDYEIFLRSWPAEPHYNHLAAFSGPVIEGVDPGSILLQQFYQWSKQLAIVAGHSTEKGIRGKSYFSFFFSALQYNNCIIYVHVLEKCNL